MERDPKTRLKNVGEQCFPEGFALIFRRGETTETICSYQLQPESPEIHSTSVDYDGGVLELHYLRNSEVTVDETQTLFLLGAEILNRNSLLAVATTLHRHTCQSLTAAKLEIDLLRMSEPESEELKRIHEVISGAVRQVRELMESLPTESHQAE